MSDDLRRIQAARRAAMGPLAAILAAMILALFLVLSLLAATVGGMK